MLNFKNKPPPAHAGGGSPVPPDLTNVRGDKNVQTQIRIAPQARARNKLAADNKPVRAHNTLEPARNTRALGHNKLERVAHTPLAAPHKPPEPETQPPAPGIRSRTLHPHAPSKRPLRRPLTLPTPPNLKISFSSFYLSFRAVLTLYQSDAPI